MTDPNESWMPGTPTGPNVSWITEPSVVLPNMMSDIPSRLPKPEMRLPRPRRLKPDEKLLIAEALKIVWDWQRYRDYLRTLNSPLTHMNEQAHLFYSTLDLHAEILSEALKGQVDPDIALTLAGALINPTLKD